MADFWGEMLQDASLGSTLPRDREPDERAVLETLSTRDVLVGDGDFAQLQLLVVAATVLVLHHYDERRSALLGVRTTNMANILPLIFQVADETTVRTFLQQVKGRIAAIESRQVPFSALIDRFPPFGTRCPCYDVALDFVGSHTPTATAKIVIRTASNLITLERSDQAVMAGVGGRLLDHVRVVMRALSVNESAQIRDISPLATLERDEIVFKRNNTGTEYQRNATIPELVDEQARTNSYAVAVRCGDTEVIYGDLVARANWLARRVMAGHTGPSTPVGVCIHPSIDMVVANLAVLKTGVPYVPIDPNESDLRLVNILRVADVGVVVVSAETAPRLRSISPIVEMPASRGYVGEPVTASGRARDPAAVLFTSGSTGVPKAVELTHQAINRVADRQSWLLLRNTDVVAQTGHLAFDACAYQIWGTLINGARLVIIPQRTLLSPRALSALVRSEQITTLGVATALFHELASRSPRVFAGVERLLVFGEQMRGDALRRVLSDDPPRQLYNLYGPTENGVFSTWHDCTASDLDPIPIGRPTPNSTVYILNRRRAPVADGVVGDIYVGGDGLSPGYRGYPDLTGERFIPHPFEPNSGHLLFDTGDRGSYRPDGVIQFHGRRDFQVKIRGFRIELEEVESLLVACPNVRMAAAIPSPDTGTNRHLIAFVVPIDGEAVDIQVIRRLLRRNLPSAGIPGRFIVVEELPLNAHGKIDRAALAELAEPTSPEPSRSESDDIEIAVAALWRDVLKDPTIGPEDDFFTIGGDSRLVMQLVSRVNALFGTHLEPAVLFDEPTINGFAEAIRSQRAPGAEHHSGEQPVEIPASKLTRAPLSWPQESLWDTCGLATGTPLYNESFTVEVLGPLSTDALITSLNDLLERHDALRTGFADTADGAVQEVSDVHILPLTSTDLGGVPATERARQAALVASQQARLPFTLDRPPLIRAQLIRYAPDHHELHLIAHHLVADGMSFRHALLPDLYALYQHHVGQALHTPAAGANSYLDYARSQRARITARSYAAQLRQVSDQLRGARATELPLSQPRPSIPSFRGARRSCSLPAEAREWITNLSRRHGMTPTTVLLAVFQIALHQVTGATDLVTGLGQDSRPGLKLDGVCGHFVNPTALRCDLTGDPTCHAILKRTHMAYINCLGARSTPLSLVEGELATEPPSPLFRIAFSVVPQELAIGPDWTARFNTLDNGTARMDLTLFADLGADAVRLMFEYATDIVPVALVDRLEEAVRSSLTAVSTEGDTRLSTLVGLGRPSGIETSAEALRVVAAAWTTQLGAPPPTQDRDFFDIGGNSVRASRLIATARHQLDVDIRHTSTLTRAFLGESTVNGLARALTTLGRNPAQSEGMPRSAGGLNFADESVLPVELDFSTRSIVPRDRPRSVLLTGATGFLGSHLLAEVLARTDATIHCLVRAESRRDAEHRIRAALGAYGAARADVDLSRVTVLLGDLAKPRLGVPEAEYQRLVGEVDTVFHNAAWVNFIYPYEKLREINVNGTTRILRLASTGCPKRLHYVSTQAVFSSLGLSGVTRVDEDTRPANPEHLLMGYVESKWVSEMLLWQAHERGLDVSVYRPHDIGGDSRTGSWKTADFLCALIRGCVEIGMVPDYRLPLDLTPVDITAQAIVDLALRPRPTRLAFHLNNPRYATAGDLTPVLADAGHPVQTVPAAEWTDNLRQHTDRHPDSVIAPFTHLFTERWTTHDISIVELYLEGRMPTMDCSATWNSITDPGITCPPGRELLPRYTDYLTRIGYLGTEGRSATS